jgi:hypothetical protein
MHYRTSHVELNNSVPLLRADLHPDRLSPAPLYPTPGHQVGVLPPPQLIREWDLSRRCTWPLQLGQVAGNNWQLAQLYVHHCLEPRWCRLFEEHYMGCASCVDLVEIARANLPR